MKRALQCQESLHCVSSVLCSSERRILVKGARNVHGDDRMACLNVVVKVTHNVHGGDSTGLSKCGTERHS